MWPMTGEGGSGEGQTQGQEQEQGQDGGSEESKSQLPEKVTLDVNGQERLVTREEATVAAQKWYAGDDTLKRASDEAKANSEAVQLYRDIQAVHERKDPEAFRRVAAALGAGAGETEDLLARGREEALVAHRGSGKEGAAGTAAESGTAETDEAAREARIIDAVVTKLQATPVGLKNMEPGLREFITSTAEGRLNTAVDRALDSDAVLSTIMKGENEKQRAAVRSMALKEVRRRAQTGEKVLAGQGIQEALQVVRAELEALGVGASGMIPHETGLGSAPGTASALHQSTPIERPRTGQSDPRYTEYLTDRIVRKMAETPQ